MTWRRLIIILGFLLLWVGVGCGGQQTAPPEEPVVQENEEDTLVKNVSIVSSSSFNGNSLSFGQCLPYYGEMSVRLQLEPDLQESPPSLLIEIVVEPTTDDGDIKVSLVENGSNQFDATVSEFTLSEGDPVTKTFDVQVGSHWYRSEEITLLSYSGTDRTAERVTYHCIEIHNQHREVEFTRLRG